MICKKRKYNSQIKKDKYQYNISSSSLLRKPVPGEAVVHRSIATYGAYGYLEIV